MREELDMTLAAPFIRTDCDFVSRGTRCAAWLYRPAGQASPPLVIMAHGFAGERVFRLGEIAERFAARGLAVLVFDYRNLGASDGVPRGLVNHFRHLDDWRAALAHARTIEGIDAGRIALWGSSYSGGQVIVLAAERPDIAGIVAQVPMVDVPGSLGRFGVKHAAFGLFHGLWDAARWLVRSGPHEVPVVAPPERFAILNRPGCDEGLRAIIPPDVPWRNLCPARVLLTSLLFRPVRVASRVRCPALLVLAERDQIIPPATVRRAAAKMPSVELIVLDADHFQPYCGELFEELVEREAAFLVRVLASAH
jgi:pimeloyl-ACP methyl ester carboxylesterase